VVGDVGRVEKNVEGRARVEPRRELLEIGATLADASQQLAW